MTHKDLVNIAYKWVLKNGSCGVAFRELNTIACNREYPDVIGFGSWTSVVIECKISRADFLSDKKKAFREKPHLGMGDYRYYCCVNGLIKKEELPEGWGLIYVNEKGRATCVHKAGIEKKNKYGHPVKILYQHKKNIRAEHQLMYSALRRLEIRGRIEEIYTDPKLIGQTIDY